MGFLLPGGGAAFLSFRGCPHRAQAWALDVTVSESGVEDSASLRWQMVPPLPLLAVPLCTAHTQFFLPR